MENDVTFVLRAKNEVRKTARAVGKDIREAGKSSKEVARESGKSADELRRVARSAGSVSRDTRKARGSMDRFEKRTAAAKREMQGLVGTTTALKGALASTAAVLGTLGVGIGGGIILTDAVGTAIKFEEAMSEVRAVSQSTADQFEALEARARELGSTTSFSGTQAAGGIAFLARAGFDARQSLEAIEPALKLARAGNLELAESADIASNIISGLGVEVSEFNRVADVLAATSSSANTGVQQLGAAFSFVAPNLNQLKISAEEGAAAIGVLSNAGIQGSRAGTNLRGVFSRLLKPTAQAREELERLGINIEDVNPATNSLVDVLEELAPVAESAASSAEVFGAEVSSGAVSLIENVDALRQLISVNQDAEGAVDRLAFVMGDNLQGALKELRSAVEELYLSLVNNRALTEFVQLLTAIVREITPASRGVRELGDGAKDAEAFMEELNQRAAELKDRLAEIKETAKDVVEALETLAKVIGIFIAAKTLIALGRMVALLRGAATAAAFANLAVKSNPIILLLSFAVALATNLDSILKGLATPSLEEETEAKVNAVVASAPGSNVEKLISLEREVNRLREKRASGEVFSPEEQKRLELTVNALERLREVSRQRDAARPESVSPLRIAIDTPANPDTPVAPDILDNLLGGGGGAVNPIRELAREIEVLRQAEGKLAEDRDRFIEAQEILRQAREAGIKVTEEEVVALLEERDAFREVGQEARTVSEGVSQGLRDLRDGSVSAASIARDAITSLSDTLSSSLIAALDGAEVKFGDFFRNLRNKIIEFSTDQAVVGLFGSLEGGFGSSGGIGGILSNLAGGLFGSGGGGNNLLGPILPGLSVPALASGGPLAGGQTALLGEEGPELFTPRSSGNVINAADTARLVQGGGKVQVEIIAPEGFTARQRGESEQIAVRVTQAGLDQFSRESLPGRVSDINDDPRKVG